MGLHLCPHSIVSGQIEAAYKPEVLALLSISGLSAHRVVQIDGRSSTKPLGRSNRLLGQMPGKPRQ